MVIALHQAEVVVGAPVLGADRLNFASAFANLYARSFGLLLLSFAFQKAAVSKSFAVNRANRVLGVGTGCQAIKFTESFILEFDSFASH